MTLQHSLPILEVRAQAQGLVEGYASVFGGVDSYGDSIAPGAFSASVAQHKTKGTSPAMLWAHKPENPIGRWTTLEEDPRGLVVKGQLNLKTSAGREAFEHLQAGDLNGLSIGFRVPPGGSKFVNGVNLLTAIELHEVSVVALPADGAARITSVKSVPVKPRSIRELEEALEHTLGYSRREARAIVAKGYNALSNPDQSLELIEALKAAALTFRKT